MRRKELLQEWLHKEKAPFKRKFAGGNIVIPKAMRFSEDRFTKDNVPPGPGAYQIESGFDRHANPL
jgi:hypothetical protein